MKRNRQDEIPPAGPVSITVRRDSALREVWLAFEDALLRWGLSNGELAIRLERVHIHSAVVIE